MHHRQVLGVSSPRNCVDNISRKSVHFAKMNAMNPGAFLVGKTALPWLTESTQPSCELGRLKASLSSEF
jgi:hypothetical protein